MPGVDGPRAALVHATARSGPGHRLDLLARELGLIGNDPSWRQVIELAATIAATRSPVLIARRARDRQVATGPADPLARARHPDRPFVTVEASAMADDVRDAGGRRVPRPAHAGRLPRWTGPTS